jgi:phosphoserine aminotransferase
VSERIYNFSPGPAVLPVAVLEQIRDELLNYRGRGMSVLEMSHRSKDFRAIRDKAEAGLRQVMAIPDEYALLFVQGGASLQFTMVPMNLYIPGKPVDVIHTGAWTQKAIGELEKLAHQPELAGQLWPARRPGMATYHIAASTEAENFKRLPAPGEIHFSAEASYVYLASNNTIFGTQWREFPDTGDIPLVADMSSDLLSRQVNVSQFGLIFAGAQKNIGPAGVTVVIVRPELAERASSHLPTMLQYRTYIQSQSLYNTPPTFGIYVIGLVMDWVEAQGGVAVIEQQNEIKARLLYEAIDHSDFYYCPVAERDRSRMNVIYRIRGDNEALEQRFVAEAEAAGLSGLKGHRSVGGLRASLYNAQTIEAVQALVDFMKAFEARYG